MSYRRTASRQDIRNIPTQTLPERHETSNLEVNAQPVVDHRPNRDVLQVSALFLIIVALIIVANYFDVKQHWVVDFASWLMHLGR